MNNLRFSIAFVLLVEIPSASFAQPNPPLGGKVTEDIKGLKVDVPLNVGDGFDLGGFLRMPSPFDSPQPVPGRGEATTNFNLFYVTSSKGLDEVSGFDMRVSVRTPFGSGGGGNKQQKGVKITEGQLHLVIVAEHSYGADSLPDDAKLKADAAALLKNKKHKEFAELYGTHFVKSQQRVARVVYVLTTTRWSEKTTKLWRTDAKADGGFGGWGGGVSVSMMDDLQREEVRNSLSISAQVTGGGEGFKTLSEIVKTAVIISDATTMNKNVGDAIAKTFEGHKRDNAGTGAMVVYSYKTIGWDPVRAILWSDEYEDKLKACAKLFTNAESLKEAVDTTRRDQGIQLPIRDKLAALSIRYDDYIKELKMHGRELIKKNPNFLKRKFPDAPRLDQETEAALFMRYAGFLERLEGVEREKHDKIEIEVRSIKSTDGVVKEIGGENVPKDVPGKERFVFQKKHARYEVFVTDVDITFPGSGDHSEIQSMRMTAKVLDFKESTDTVHVEYRLFIKSEHKRFAFKGTAKLIVIGY